MKKNYSLYRRILLSNQWQSDARNIPIKQQAWLMCQSSLTEKLQQICHHFDVELLHQGWQKYDDQNGQFWLREVLLKGDNIPWIYAQTIVPEETIKNVAQELLNLGEKPLGLWLFPQNPKRINLDWLKDPQTALFARRSTLTISGYPLEIRELFLNSFKFS